MSTDRGETARARALETIEARLARAADDAETAATRCAAILEVARLVRARGLAGASTALRAVGAGLVDLARDEAAPDAVGAAAIGALGEILWHPAAASLRGGVPPTPRRTVAMAAALPRLLALARVHGRRASAGRSAEDEEEDVRILAALVLELAESARGVRTIGRVLVPRLGRATVSRALATAAARDPGADRSAAAVARLLARTSTKRSPGPVRSGALAAMIGALEAVAVAASPSSVGTREGGTLPRPVSDLFRALGGVGEPGLTAALVPVIARGGPLGARAARAARRNARDLRAGTVPTLPSTDAVEAWLAWRAQPGVPCLEAAAVAAV